MTLDSYQIFIGRVVTSPDVLSKILVVEVDLPADTTSVFTSGKPEITDKHYFFYFVKLSVFKICTIVSFIQQHWNQDSILPNSFVQFSAIKL